jgi:N-acetyl-anhydromuramyl-L-alanine amidase AmpD
MAIRVQKKETMAVTIYKIGSRGAVVKQIQKALDLYPDGIYGPLTAERVRDFQRENGLTPDGIVGPATLAKLLPQTVATALRLKKSKRRIDEIIIHCTATPEGKDKTVEQIRKEHKAQGWADIGYHYIIYRDGSVHEGRDVNIAGAHVSGHNSYSIGIAYVGGLEPETCAPYHLLKPKDTRTDLQKAALLSLLLDLRKLYPKAIIQGHRDFSPDKNGNGIVEPNEWVKDCPCFNAKAEYRRV